MTAPSPQPAPAAAADTSDAAFEAWYRTSTLGTYWVAVRAAWRAGERYGTAGRELLEAGAAAMRGALEFYAKPLSYREGVPMTGIDGEVPVEKDSGDRARAALSSNAGAALLAERNRLREERDAAEARFNSALEAVTKACGYWERKQRPQEAGAMWFIHRKIAALSAPGAAVARERTGTEGTEGT